MGLLSVTSIYRPTDVVSCGSTTKPNKYWWSVYISIMSLFSWHRTFGHEAHEVLYYLRDWYHPTT